MYVREMLHQGARKVAQESEPMLGDEVEPSSLNIPRFGF
jgi:hypothetical protein